MTIQLLTRPGSPVLEVQVSDKLERADYEDFSPVVEKLVSQHGKINVLFVMRDFHGWTAGALWKDLKFDLQHFNDIERLAMVGDREWEKGMAKFCKPFTTAEIQWFDLMDLRHAREWVKQ